MCSLLAENTNGIVRKHVISTIYYYLLLLSLYVQFFVAFDKDSNLSIQQKSDIFCICYHAQIRIYLSFKMQTMYSNNAKARGSLKLIAISFRRSLNTSES